MIAERENAKVVAELHALSAAGALTPEQVRSLSQRYPVGPWDLRILAKLFALFGAVSMAAGITILLPRFVRTEYALEAALTLGAAALLVGARRLRRSAPRIAATMELMAGLAVQGLCVVVAKFHSSGSDNWPALVGLTAALLLGLAYALANRLVLIHACATAFVFFGGETGYASGWGVYWLGMDYPLRFLVAGVVCVGLAALHAQALTGARQGFARVWAHAGLLSGNLSLWFLALFGLYEKHQEWSTTTATRAAFSAAWALVALTSLLAGARSRIGILRAYGLVFLIIDVYTAYGQFVAANTAMLWFVHLLLMGGSLFALGAWLERRRKQGEASPEPAA